MHARVLGSVVLIGASIGLVACGSSGSSTTRGSTTATDLSSCTPASLKTHAANTLTVGTDQPAYPPYFVNNDPSNGQGFESAVAYAVAKTLGYPAHAVTWTTVPFDSSYAPGPTTSTTTWTSSRSPPARKKAVDFSAPYYDVAESIVAMKGTKAASVTDAGRAARALKLGAQLGTTDADTISNVIKPSSARLLHQQRPCGAGAQERPDRRARGRPADRVLHHLGAGQGHGHRRVSWLPAPTPGAVRRAAGEGQPAHHLREQGGGRAEGQRAVWRRSRPSGWRTRATRRVLQ